MSSLKNIIIILACIVCAGFVYYITKPDLSTADISAGSKDQQELLFKTKLFIERSTLLQQIKIEPSFFVDKTFTSLRSFSTPVPNQPLGRTDLFGATASVDSGAGTDLTE